MKALLIENEKLILSDVDMPSEKDDEILIEVYAAAVNRADILQRKGTYPSPKGQRQALWNRGCC